MRSNKIRHDSRLVYLPRYLSIRYFNLRFFSGATSTFTTSEEYNRDQLILSVADRKAVLLKIKAKENAHILLYEQYHASLAYEVIIGGDKNQITGIKLYVQSTLLLNEYRQTSFIRTAWYPLKCVRGVKHVDY